MFKFIEKLCIEAKEKLHKNSEIGIIWKDNFSYSNKIGNCTNLYRLLRPTSYKDFYFKYIKYASENIEKKIYDRGLTYGELITLAEEYKSMCESKTNLKYDLEIYFYDALCHIIIETKDGQKNEEDFIRYLESIGYECSNIDGRNDAKFGVDIKLVKDGNDFGFIQVKPISFFKTNRADTQNDRIKLCEKYEMTKKEYGLDTFYAIYSKKNDRVYWYKNGKSFCFRINDLFTYDKTDIPNTFVRKPIKDIYEPLPI